jgi:hypothetical protein
MEFSTFQSGFSLLSLSDPGGLQETNLSFGISV